MAGGHPKKKSKNVSGLCNQHQQQPFNINHQPADLPNAEDVSDDSETGCWQMEVYGMKPQGYRSEFDGDKSDISEEDTGEGLDDEEFCRRLDEMAEQEDDKDCDWIP
ncbi:hypothetical protein F5J12DRAFT_781622 [Pisolithus orientalis]|uniref:uncharacterized protein n=1 Tax=Pisolithus orientalis TaxID=936130 RepID=UPI002224B6AD|nr:uncharacterized protein F5J12DRAFT_781622 [Pisolithus orientalis]KAI6012755.1 hypothetical protein F5J12DRAFT_781622 [Pisolithus orientalis]